MCPFTFEHELIAKETYMRYLIISDILSNLAAFQAVVDDAEGKYDKVWCLGDVVGYGPDPNECVERMRALPHVSGVGNHDWATLGTFCPRCSDHHRRTRADGR